ncbi:MAG: ATP synthase F0 subunit B [Clostridiales bacterium]|nr:ATP synthase F0 subunit B [Clostridiales bacterium]
MSLLTPPGRVFGLDMQTVFSVGIHLFNLALLAFILARFLYKPVRDYLFKRTARISEQLMRAGEEMHEAEYLKQEYEEKLLDFERDREALLALAQKQAQEQCGQLLDEARVEADAMRAAAAEEINEEKQRVQAEMQRVIIEVATAMASKYVALSLDEATHRRLFDQTLSELEEVTWWQ